MNMFNEIQGLKEENLSSAVIRMLLLQSHQLRDAFIELLSTESKQGPIFVQSKFSCVTEQSTDDDNHGKGRIDFVLETDDFLIGIENKINAGFQTGQPEKYIKTLRDKSEKTYKDGKTESSKTMLAILIPESRVDQIRIEIEKLTIPPDDKDIIAVISWEDVLAAFKEVIENCDNISQVMFNDLRDFMLERISFFPKFRTYFPHFRNTFTSTGNQFQRMFVGKLWRIFPKSGPRLGAGGTWCGYYFNYPKDPSEQQNQCWYGFVSPKELIGYAGKHAAEFIIAVPFDSKCVKHENLTPVELSNKHFTQAGIGHDTALIVNFDSSWDDPEKWKDVINCIVSHL